MNIRILKPQLSTSRRPPGTVVDTVVLHATAGSTLAGAISTLRERRLSYHYLIDKSDDVVKCAPTGMAAKHAGESLGPQGEWVNRYSVGISFVNLNDGRDPYTPAQIEAARELILALRKAIPTLRHLTTHYAIAPNRKTDPRSFPVPDLAAETGLELWLG